MAFGCREAPLVTNLACTQAKLVMDNVEDPSDTRWHRARGSRGWQRRLSRLEHLEVSAARVKARVYRAVMGSELGAVT